MTVLVKMKLGRNCFAWAATLVWMLGLVLCKMGLSSWPKSSSGELVYVMTEAQQVVKAVKAVFTLFCNLMVFHHWRIECPALLPPTFRKDTHSKVMRSLSIPGVNGKACSNACAVCTAKIEEEHRRTKSWNDLWKAICQMFVKKGGIQTCMCFLGWSFAWNLPSPSVFSLLLSHRIISFSGYSPTTLFFFFHPLLCISQSLQSTAYAQKGHDSARIPWCGAQGSKVISSNTTHDSQMLLMICFGEC